MAQAEKYSWLSLITTGLIFIFFKMRMMDGWEIVDSTPRHMLITYGLIILLFIVTEAIIAAYTALSSKSENIEKDERDIQIERQAEQYPSWFILVAVNTIIVHLLFNTVIEGYEYTRFDLSHTPTVFFILLSMLIIATLITRISTVLLYTLQHVRNN